MLTFAPTHPSAVCELPYFERDSVESELYHRFVEHRCGDHRTPGRRDVASTAARLTRNI